MVSELRKLFELKVSGKLGPESQGDKQVRILNRTVEWTSDGIRYEHDSRHAEIVVKQFKMHDKGVISVVTPDVKDDSVSDETPLDAAMSSLYRSLKKRINYQVNGGANVASWNKLKE